MTEAAGIAIIGGGASGTMLAVQLAAQARTALLIRLYDTSGAFARGVAYGTHDPLHFLNVRADRMGAFAKKPEDFVRWLATAQGGQKPDPTRFMPRMQYGDYLAALLSEAERSGKARIERHAQEVVDATFGPGEVTLKLAHGGEHRAHNLALSIGSLSPRRAQNEQELLSSGRYANPIWQAPKGSLLTRGDFVEADSPVLIIGTGLTMVDAILTLRRKGYRGKIIAASRDGLLPQPHLYETPSWPRFLLPESAPRTALLLLRAVRAELKRAGGNWRGVVDSLRADTPRLWANLPERERARLLRVASFWNTHRHRVPPESGAQLAREIADGTLRILRGRVKRMEAAPGGIRAWVTGRTEPLTFGHVLNCSGPESDISRAESPLLRSLLAQNAITPGPLRLGIAAEENYRARGSARDRLFVMGPQLLGERFETVAMPELRAQAEELAEILLRQP